MVDDDPHGEVEAAYVKAKSPRRRRSVTGHDRPNKIRSGVIVSERSRIRRVQSPSVSVATSIGFVTSGIREEPPREARQRGETPRPDDGLQPDPLPAGHVARGARGYDRPCRGEAADRVRPERRQRPCEAPGGRG